jgi:hypothetical protein
MSDFMKIILKEFSQDLSSVQIKKKEISTKFDPESKTKLIEEIKNILKRADDKIEKIDTEYRIMSTKMRNEYKGTIDTNKSELIKIKSDINKLEYRLKKENLLIDSKDEDEKFEKNRKLKKIDNQNDELDTVYKMQKDIYSTNEKTILTLKKGEETILRTIGKTEEVEQALSLHDQIFQVMNNRELFNKLKLVMIVALLAIADLIILYIKLG